MSMKLPIYRVAGEKLVSVEKTSDGGLRLLGWDFERDEMVRNVSWDEVCGHLEEAVAVKGSAHVASGGETFEITSEEFDRRLEELRAPDAR